MDRMRISGIEPSSVILSQTMYCKRMNCDGQLMPKQFEANRGGVMNHKMYKMHIRILH